MHLKDQRHPDTERSSGWVQAKLVFFFKFFYFLINLLEIALKLEKRSQFQDEELSPPEPSDSKLPN